MKFNISSLVMWLCDVMWSPSQYKLDPTPDPSDEEEEEEEEEGEEDDMFGGSMSGGGDPAASIENSII